MLDLEDRGAFVEIEAIDRDGDIGLDAIQGQLEKFKELLSIKDEDILKESYIDML